jgi:hypothetical protein
MTPFEAIYSQNPPSVISYMLGVLKVQEVEKNLIVHKTILHPLKDNLVMDQNHMKQQAYQGCSEFHFVEGGQVFIRLQPYKKTSLKYQHFQKLAPNFYGPYTMLKHVGYVAYQLSLPI